MSGLTIVLEMTGLVGLAGASLAADVRRWRTGRSTARWDEPMVAGDTDRLHWRQTCLGWRLEGSLLPLDVPGPEATAPERRWTWGALS